MDGYSTYLEALYELQEDLAVHEIYMLWYRKYVMVASPKPNPNPRLCRGF